MHRREQAQHIHTLAHHRELGQHTHKLPLGHHMELLAEIELAGWSIPHICMIVCAPPLARELELEHCEERDMGVQQEQELELHKVLEREHLDIELVPLGMGVELALGEELELVSRLERELDESLQLELAHHGELVDHMALEHQHELVEELAHHGE